MLSPNDHARLLVELLRPGGAALGQRWLAALMAVPAAEREAVVAAVEERVQETYGTPEVGAEWPHGLRVVMETLRHTGPEDREDAGGDAC